jgi:hypothetical protein
MQAIFRATVGDSSADPTVGDPGTSPTVGDSSTSPTVGDPSASPTVGDPSASPIPIAATPLASVNEFIIVPIDDVDIAQIDVRTTMMRRDGNQWIPLYRRPVKRQPMSQPNYITYNGSPTIFIFSRVYVVCVQSSHYNVNSAQKCGFWIDSNPKFRQIYERLANIHPYKEDPFPEPIRVQFAKAELTNPWIRLGCGRVGVDMERDVGIGTTIFTHSDKTRHPYGMRMSQFKAMFGSEFYADIAVKIYVSGEHGISHIGMTCVQMNIH